MHGRREFLRNSALAAAGLGTSSSLQSQRVARLKGPLNIDTEPTWLEKTFDAVLA